jgi:hypothetical protein
LDDFSKSFGVGLEVRVPEKSADIFSHFVFFDCQMNEAIARVAESPIIEVGITRKKGGPPQGVQQRDNLFPVVESFLPDVSPDLVDSNPPRQ